MSSVYLIWSLPLIISKSLKKSSITGTMDQLPKILIIGDSSALPRDDVRYEETYFYFLKKNLQSQFDFLNLSVWGNNSRKISSEIDFLLRWYRPYAVILNFGIVDAFPRPYPHWLSVIWRFLSYFRLDVDRFLKKTGLYYSLGDLFNCKTVPFAEFKRHTGTIMESLKKNGVNKVFIIGIIMGSGKISRSKRAHKEFDIYNTYFRQFCSGKDVVFIDMSQSGKDSVVSDGYHYNLVASSYLSDRIISLLQNRTLENKECLK